MKKTIDWMIIDGDSIKIYYTFDRYRGEYLQVQYKEDWEYGPVLVAGDVVTTLKKENIKKCVYETIQTFFEGEDWFVNVISDFIDNLRTWVEDFQKKERVTFIASSCTRKDIFKLKMSHPKFVYINVGGVYVDCDIVTYPDTAISIKTKAPIWFEKETDWVFTNGRYNYFFATLDDFREIGDVEIRYYR